MANATTEKEEIRKSHAKAQWNSGRGTQKGDATLGPFLVDIKEFEKTFGLSKSVWQKISKDAVHENLEPSLKVILGNNKDGFTRLWVVHDHMFEEMLEAWTEKYG